MRTETSNDDRMYDVTRRNQGEHLVVITPTAAAATNQAAGIIYALGQDKALLNAVIAAAVNRNPHSTGTGLIRTDVLRRLGTILTKACEVELSLPEADVLLDDIGDAMVPPPDCDIPDCARPEDHQGLCWVHYREREVLIAERTAAARQAVTA